MRPYPVAVSGGSPRRSKCEFSPLSAHETAARHAYDQSEMTISRLVSFRSSLGHRLDGFIKARRSSEHSNLAKEAI